MSRRSAIAVSVAALLAALGVPLVPSAHLAVADTSRPENAVTRVLYQAYNVVGPTIRVDGTDFVGNAPDLSVGPYQVCDQNAPITPPVSPELDALVRCFGWGGYIAQGQEGFGELAFTVTGIPDGRYEISFWNWEDTISETFNVVLEGNEVDVVTTVPGQLRVLGPYPFEVRDGVLDVDSVGGAFNISAVRIDRLIDVPPTLAPKARFQSVTPTRVLDTRPVSRVNHTGGKPGDGAIVDVQITGQAGVPAGDAVAAVLNITATESSQSGFVTVFPTGTRVPPVSSLNMTQAGQTVPNFSIVPIGVGGRVSLFTNVGTHLVVDLLGYFTTAPGATDGRYHPITPARVLDTRPATAVNHAAPKPGRFSVTRVPIRGQADVPVTARAVAVTITATEADAAGFVTAYPSGIARPLSSNLNIPGRGSTIANMAIVPIGSDGGIELYAQMGTHLIVDVQGWFGDGTEPGTGGFYVAQTPTRTTDSRPGRELRGLPIGPYAPLSVVSPSLGISPNGETVIAVVYNMTATQTAQAGFLTGFPSGSPVPTASNLNAASANTTVAATSITRLGTDRRLSILMHAGGHVIIDVSGWFTA